MFNSGEKPQHQDGHVEESDVEKTLGSMPEFGQHQLDGYIQNCAKTLAEYGIHDLGYYEPEDGDTLDDARKAGLEEIADILSIDKEAINNLFQNDIDIDKCFNSGVFYDAANDASWSSQTDAESQTFDTIRTLGEDYFGESATQAEKDLMKDILYTKGQSDGTLAEHWELTDEQKAYLESKNDTISRRLLEDREGLSRDWEGAIADAEDKANEYCADGEGDPEDILAKLQAAKKLVEKRKNAGIETYSGSSLDDYVEYVQDRVVSNAMDKAVEFEEGRDDPEEILLMLQAAKKLVERRKEAGSEIDDYDDDSEGLDIYIEDMQERIREQDEDGDY